MDRMWRLLVTSTVVAVGLTVGQQPASAACHSFTVAADPGSVSEGGTVTVTVTRDAGVNPSRVDVSSVDETARAGEDFPAVQRTISFTTETQQTFTVVVTDDSMPESAETFRLHLSNPGGCAVNPNFVVGADARVTIPANDTAGTTSPTTRPASPAPMTAPLAPSTTKVGAGTTASSETTAEMTSTTAAADVSASASATTTTELNTERAIDASDKDGGGAGGAGAVVVIAAVLALGGGGYLLYRRRATHTP